MKNYYYNDIDVIAQSELLNSLKGKTILISGANGMIGKYIIHTIQRYNDEYNKGEPCKIIAVCRNYSKAVSLFGNDNNIQYIIKDICEANILDYSIDYCIHAASITNPNDYSRIPVDMISANVFGTYNLLESLRHKNCKSFLYISSASVYGSNVLMPCKEECLGVLDYSNVSNSYSISKRTGEFVCRSFFKQYGIPIKIVRPFHMYGPGMRLDDGRLFDNLINKIINDNDILLHSDGKRLRNFCYLRNVIEYIFLILFKGTVGETYNLGSVNNTISIRELVDMLIRISNSKVNVVYSDIEYKSESNKMDMIPCLDKLKDINVNSDIVDLELEDGIKRLLDYVLYENA